MTPAEEENFPRGCKKVILPRKRPKDENLFHTETSHKAKKSKRNKKPQKEAIAEKTFYNSIKIQGTLTYNKIQEGMIILGCVRHITNFSLEIELPGLTFGFVHITNISDAFTKHLSNTLEQNGEESHDILRDMFKIGQFVAVKVLNIENEEKGTKVKCSLKPNDINYEKSHDSFKKGMLAWACVQSVLDHGYEMNLGVKNCRVFLPSKNVDEGRLLGVGEPMWCAIHKSESTSSVTTIRVSSKTEHIKKLKIDELNSLHDVVPGMQMEIVTEKITSNGIQGKFLNNFFGYVDQTQLRTPSDELGIYKEGKLITAYVLYIEPSTKITHFTLRSLESVPAPSHAPGDILSATVTSKGSNGIYLESSSKEKCFVTNRRLMHALPKNANLDMSEAIAVKFPTGSKHTCRILDYSRMSKMYICALDQALVKEKLFCNKDIGAGKLLKVTVDSVKLEGLCVVSGHIRGFVPNLHISNTKYSQSLKKKFKPGDKINARVLFTKDDNVIFTLKSGLVESEKCLTSLEQVKRGDQYAGVIVKTNLSGALVVFYNNVLGWISRRRLGGEDGQVDPTEYFYRGQVVNPWVLGAKEDKVILTLKPPSSFKKEVKIEIGQKIRGIVGKVHKDRVDIKSSKGVMLGIVPVNHLGSSLGLCFAILKNLKMGDVLPDLLCVDNRNTPFILSRREALMNKRRKTIKIKNFKNLRPGNLLRCSYVSTCDEGIYVLPLILDFVNNILVKTENVVEKGEALPKFSKDQSVVAKVLTISHDTKEICLTVRNDVAFDNSVETVVGYFSQHLGDVKYLRALGADRGCDICRYQPGERVLCTVERLGEEGGCLVSLPNGVKGLVAPHLCPDNLEPGQAMEGVFLSQDFGESYVEICLKRDISLKINDIQDGIVSIPSLASCIIENILVKSDYVLGVLKQNGGNRQLVYIPLYLYENDRKGCHAYYQKDKLKICICSKFGDYLIGMSKNLFLTLDQQKLQLPLERTLSGNTNRTNGMKPTKRVNKTETMDVISIQDSIENKAITEEIQEGDDDGSKSDGGLTDKNSTSDICGNKRKREENDIGTKIQFGNEFVKNFATGDSVVKPLPVLPGVSLFFSPGAEQGDMTSSDEEEEVKMVKKKKMSPAERAELTQREEERLSRIERELADSAKMPETAEQFERLLLANPNSSELWVRYVTFHIAAAELDKARSVAKRALETIDMTATTEKFNVWISLLNLENLFGTKESFDKTFEEAIKYNDSLDVYLNVIKMLAEAEKFTDMDEKIGKVRNKHKQEPTMWLEVAKTYYSIKKPKEARNIKEAALKSIRDRKMQLNLIIRFAVMEFKYGEEQHGAAIFETILSSDPNKVNVWIIYVDQLIKKDRIDQARRVLERSVCQRLPSKSMKSLFLKYRMFEERHGTLDSVEAVKQKAAEYVTNAVKN